MNGPVRVQAVLAEYVRKHDMPEDLVMAALAVSALVEATRRTIEAFEGLGRAQGVAATHLARRECEVAMVAQKAALALCGNKP